MKCPTPTGRGLCHVNSYRFGGSSSPGESSLIRVRAIRSRGLFSSCSTTVSSFIKSRSVDNCSLENRKDVTCNASSSVFERTTNARHDCVVRLTGVFATRRDTTERCHTTVFYSLKERQVPRTSVTHTACEFPYSAVAMLHRELL